MSEHPPEGSSRPSSAVVLAAGEGTRLRPLTANRPKPMLPAGTRPILEHVFNALIEAGIDDLHLVVGYHANRVRSHFGSTYREVPITYHTQTNQLGSGHALLQAQDGPNESFLLVNGDQLIDHRIVEEVKYHHTDAAATLAVVEGPNAAEYGALKMDGETVTKLIEQPANGEYRLFNAGVYAFNANIFETLDGLSVEQGELPLTDAISRLITEGQTVQGIRTDHFWMDATHPWDLLSLSRGLLARRWVHGPETDSTVYIDDSAHIHSDATLVGPVVIDSDVVVEAGAVVGPYVSVGANTTIGANSVLKDVVIDTGSTIGPNTTAIECVTGQNCEIGPGVTISGGPADVVVDEQVYSNVDLGGVLADRVTVGGAATLEAGTLIGPGAVVGDGVVVGGRIDADSEVVR